MQLQALLCRHEGVEVAAHLESIMEGSALKMEAGALSLHLLTFPHTGKMKQVRAFRNEQVLLQSINEKGHGFLKWV